MIKMVLFVGVIESLYSIIFQQFTNSSKFKSNMAYNVTLHPEVEDNESSWFNIDIVFDNDTRAAIGVTAYKSWQCANYPCVWWENMYLNAAKDVGEIQNGSASEATIDGKDGYIIRQEILDSATNRVVNSTIAEYWVDAEEIEGYGLMAAETEVEMNSRETCMEPLKNNGYPQSMASFYCD
jgi:hypothetical protein